MIENLKRYFDMIIFDGTPGLIVTDAIIVARLVDTSIIVTSHNTTKKDSLLKVKKSLESVGASVAGVILNKVPVNAKKYENSYYYGSSEKKSSDHDDIFEKNSRTISSEDKIAKELEEYYRNKGK